MPKMTTYGRYKTRVIHVQTDKKETGCKVEYPNPTHWDKDVDPEERRLHTWEELWRKHRRTVERYAWAKHIPHYDVEDRIQEYSLVLKHVDEQYVGKKITDEHFKAILLTALRNKRFDLLRKYYKKSNILAKEVHTDDTPESIDIDSKNAYFMVDTFCDAPPIVRYVATLITQGITSVREMGKFGITRKRRETIFKELRTIMG